MVKDTNENIPMLDNILNYYKKNIDMKLSKQ